MKEKIVSLMLSLILLASIFVHVDATSQRELEDQKSEIEDKKEEAEEIRCTSF